MDKHGKKTPRVRIRYPHVHSGQRPYPTPARVRCRSCDESYVFSDPSRAAGVLQPPGYGNTLFAHHDPTVAGSRAARTSKHTGAVALPAGSRRRRCALHAAAPSLHKHRLLVWRSTAEPSRSSKHLCGRYCGRDVVTPHSGRRLKCGPRQTPILLRRHHRNPPATVPSTRDDSRGDRAPNPSFR